MKKTIFLITLMIYFITGCTASVKENPTITICEHVWSQTDCYTRQVCLQCGIEGAYGPHYFSSPTCVFPGKCAVCDAQIPELSHDLLPADCETPSHCSRCEYTVGSVLGHEGDSTCIRCGVRIGPRFDIVLEPGTIQRDNLATLSFMGEPDTLYSITVYVKSGPSSAKGLEPKTSDATGYVTWSWWVGSSSTPGTYKIVISSKEITKVLEYTITS